MKYLVAFVASIAIAAGAAGAQTQPAPNASGAPIAPSVVAASPSNYDSQTITVTGTVKGVQTRTMRRGTLTQYQLCDSQCINVVQFGEQSSSVADGQTQTVTGRFRAKVPRGPLAGQSVLIVGGMHHRRPH